VRRKTEAQIKKEARERAAKALRRTKQRYGLGEPAPLKGAVSSPLHTQGERRNPRLSPTSDRIPGPAASSNLLQDHKWKPGAKESAATVTEIRRQVTVLLAPALRSLVEARANSIRDCGMSASRSGCGFG
jgi:hypothetical protein